MLKTTSLGSFKRMTVFNIGFAVIIAMGGCGGSGGGGGGPVLPSEENVTISGRVDDGLPNSPIQNAQCRFVDRSGTIYRTADSGANGEFTFVVPPNVEGIISCYPLNLRNLKIYTFSSTMGRAAGETMTDESVTPATTIVAQIINSENPIDPRARKEELLRAIEAGSDNDLNIIVLLTTWLYKAMLEKSIDVNFAGSGGEGGNGGGDGDGDGGGVGGAAGDGGDFSPIPNAQCEFIASNDLKSGKVLYSAALDDFLDDGTLNRPDLKLVADDILPALQNYQSDEIQAAFSRFFENGIGHAYVDVTDENGEYFIPVPPNVPGFVRCFPPDKDRLILATYVSERQRGEILLGQDVNPATTVFSITVASMLSTDWDSTKKNYLEDIDGLKIYIRERSEEDVKVLFFSLCEPPPGSESPPEVCTPDDIDDIKDQKAAMVAFSATSLFNSFYQNDVNGDYFEALENLISEGDVITEDIITLGVPAVQALELRRDITEHAANALNTELSTASSTARIDVTVTEVPGGKGIAGAVVDISNNVSCDGCGTETSVEGLVTLYLDGLPPGATEINITVKGVPGYAQANAAVQVSPLARVDVEVAMDASIPKVVITSPTLKTVYTTYNSRLFIGGTASEDVDISRVTWTNDRGGSGSCTGTSSWQTVEISLFSGTNVITIAAQDAAGNIGIATLTVTYVLRTYTILPQPLEPIPIKPIVPIAPTVTITSPTTDPDYTTYDGALKLSGAASDDGAVIQVTWFNDRGGSGTCLITNKLETNDISIGWSTGDISLSLGTNVITITAQDAAGNTGSAKLTVTYALRLYPVYPIPLEPVPINPVVPITPAVTTASPTTG